MSEAHLDCFGFSVPTDVVLPSLQTFQHNVEFYPDSCTSAANLILNPDGTLERNKIGGVLAPVPGTWYSEETPGIGADYEVRATFLSGDALHGTSSATGVWLSLSAMRQWTLRTMVVGLGSDEKMCEVQIEIRRVSDLVVVGDAIWYFWVTAEVA